VLHGLQAALSRLHSKVEPASVDAIVMLPLVKFDGIAGLTEKDVSGGDVSTVQLQTGGFAVLLPAMSTPLTEKV
jgi:hypothetical protein